MNTNTLRFAAVFAIGALCGSAAMMSSAGQRGAAMPVAAAAPAAANGNWGNTSVPMAADAMAAVRDDGSSAAAPSF